MIRYFIAIGAILSAAMPSQVSLAQQGPMEVFPREASSAPVMEVSEFVALLVPREGMEAFDWDHLVDGPVVWTSDGVEIEKGAAIRRGLVRLTIGQKTPRVLKQKYEELAWTLEFRADELIKWGPKSMRLEIDCFGSLTRDCAYSVDDIRRNSALSVERLCPTPASTTSEVYKLVVEGKKPVLLVYGWDGGSGGGSNWLEFYSTSKEKELCRDGK